MPPRQLVLLHGFTQTGRSWDHVRAALGAGHQAYAPDLPGHGALSHRRPIDLPGTLAYLSALKQPRFTLAGYSMGGRIALHAALHMPRRIERLILIGASPGIADEAERTARRAADEALADRIEQAGLEAFVQEWGAQELFAGIPRGIAHEADQDRLRNTAAGLAAALRGLGTGHLPSLWDRLGELAVPVVLVAGERDAKFRAIAERMAERIPRSELAVLGSAGHPAHLERPDSVAEILRAAG